MIIMIVVGGFIRSCVQEYQRMTFSQTVVLQKQWKGYYTDPECLKQPLKIRKVNHNY